MTAPARTSRLAAVASSASCAPAAQDTHVVLRELTLTAGHVENPNGGAVNVGGGSLSMTGCTVQRQPGQWRLSDSGTRCGKRWRHLCRPRQPADDHRQQTLGEPYYYCGGGAISAGSNVACRPSAARLSDNCDSAAAYGFGGAVNLVRRQLACHRRQYRQRVMTPVSTAPVDYGR